MPFAKCIKTKLSNSNFNYDWAITIGREYEYRQSSSIGHICVLYPGDGKGALRVPAECFDIPAEGTAPAASMAKAKAEKHKCKCSMRDLMSVGCKCGGV